MQEIGFALGKGVPWVSLKLENTDPPGFIGHKQALRGSLVEPARSAPAVYKLLGEAVGKYERMQTALVSSFADSNSFMDTKARFELMDELVQSLTDDEQRIVVDAYNKNNQIGGAGYMNHRRILNFMHAKTKRRFKTDNLMLGSDD